MADHSLCVLLIFVLLQSCGVDSPAEADSNNTTDTAYTEPHRPQFHFSPPEQWMNDPNGMVYFDGEYHLFYQHYPDSNVWGPMHWGHAVSEDLVLWENLPIALYPDSLGYIFSGSAVVDENNTSGLGEDGKPPLIAIFTYHDPDAERAGTDKHQTQAIAYSTDRGRTWTKYEGNPIVPNPGIRDFRDPKVFWHEESGNWVMIFAALDRVRLYTSPDLKNWTFASEFGEQAGSHGGVWECPDLFELKIEGSDEARWVILLSINPGGPNGGSATQYFLGDFDGEKFTLDPLQKETLWLDHGRDNYAGVTWSDIPEQDGRRIFMGWMSNWDYANVVPTTKWRSAMTLPRSLHLKETLAGLRLLSRPVRELSALRGPSSKLEPGTINGIVKIEDLNKEITPSGLEIILEFSIPENSSGKVGVELSNASGESYRIGYDASGKAYYSDRTKAGTNAFSDNFGVAVTTAPRVEKSSPLKMHLFFDTASAELFADGGSTVITEIFFPSTPFTTLSLFSENMDDATLVEGTSYAISSIWHP